MELTLEAAKVRLTHKNDRLEKHGEDEVLACDLDFEYDTGNQVLAFFGPGLRSALYKRPEGAQEELIADPEHLTDLRCPEMPGPHKLVGSMAKAELVFHRGQKKHVVFAEAKIHKFSVACMDGGTVTVHFQAQVHPDEAQAGKLSGLLQDKHCQISITPALPLAGGAAAAP